jgi:glutaminyl-peptide cyclotransferase
VSLDASAAFSRIVAQHELGPRFVGSPGHTRAHALLAGWLAGADLYREHTFRGRFFGAEVTCRNLWGRYDGTRPGRILLGSHFDTRPWADQDPDPARRRDPVPGANDGGSGVALLAELAATLLARRDRCTVDLVFFDAEDWHEIDGKQVSLGARQFARDLAPADRPDLVVILDMIGGRDLRLDFDVTAEEHDPSLELALRLFRLGTSLGLPAFRLEEKLLPYKGIGCDHSPFRREGIPSAILIDIDYPPWHTTSDLPDACAVESLGQMATLLEELLYGRSRLRPAGG